MPNLFQFRLQTILAAAMLLALSAPLIVRSEQPVPKFRSQEVSEIDGYPVVMKNLPDWENVKQQAKFASDKTELANITGERTFLTAIDMKAGTEAAYAEYPAGKMLLVEFMSPQGSIDADSRIQSVIDGDGSIIYRRIGNYNVIVYDISDRASAEALIDQVKYEKQIHWLGENPFLISEEQAFIMTTRDIFISTVKVIVGGFGVAILGGLVIGAVYFRMRDRRRQAITTYTDAGGMTRLNLDGYTPDPDIN